MKNDCLYIAKLKNALESQQGTIIFDFLQTKLIEHANSNIPAECIKGMAKLIWDLQDVITQFYELKKKNDDEAF
ncbi:MAG: hypothetical protein ACLSWI_01600 [Candidatus Gastranaerophilaceae bacterium]